VSHIGRTLATVPIDFHSRTTANSTNSVGFFHRPRLPRPEVHSSSRGYTPLVTEYGTLRVKTGLAEMLKGGVIMDVVDAEQAVIAEDAGAVAVMALERVPADIRAEGGVARMADPRRIREIQEAVTIPVMAKCRIGHFAEAQILEALEVDYIDESEVLTPTDLENHVDKWTFTVPFVCGATNLGEALRRISEGAAMIRTKGEAGTGDIVNAVTHMRAVFGTIRGLQAMRKDELYAAAKELRAPYELVRWVAEHGRLPVVTFTAGGIATPADASLCMQLGADGVFVGSGIFKSGRDPRADREGWVDDVTRRARAIVEATTHFDDPKVLAEVSTGLGQPMVGISAGSLPEEERLEIRGW
jgi:pyridoxal 5'-phosphate synthase pdxS subunit